MGHHLASINTNYGVTEGHNSKIVKRTNGRFINKINLTERAVEISLDVKNLDY